MKEKKRCNIGMFIQALGMLRCSQIMNGTLLRFRHFNPIGNGGLVRSYENVIKAAHRGSDLLAKKCVHIKIVKSL